MKSPGLKKRSMPHEQGHSDNLRNWLAPKKLGASPRALLGVRTLKALMTSNAAHLAEYCTQSYAASKIRVRNAAGAKSDVNMQVIWPLDVAADIDYHELWTSKIVMRSNFKSCA